MGGGCAVLKNPLEQKYYLPRYLLTSRTNTEDWPRASCWIQRRCRTLCTKFSAG